MKGLLLALALLSPLGAHAESRWQITFKYDSNGPSAIIGAQKISPLKKTVSQPGRLSAAELHHGLVAWKRGEETIFSVDADLPIGDRFAGPTIMPSVGVIRVSGPDALQAGDIVEITLSGQASQASGVSTRTVARAARAGNLTFVLQPAAYLNTLAGPIAAQKIVNNGSDTNRFVIVILGDGYRLEDIQSGLFDQDVQDEIQHLNTESPWDKLGAISNVYSVSVASNEAGADDPCAPDAAQGCVVAARDTYFNSTYGYAGTDRLLSADIDGQARVYAAADQQVGAGVWDAIILIVNSDKYGGSGGGIATASRSGAEVVVHEMGHTVAGLADEYSSAYPGYPDGTPEPNVDSNPYTPKWQRWLTPGVELPTPDAAGYESIVGAFEGARYKETGVYRPMQDCKMRSLAAPFCPVCKEALSKAVLDQLQIVDSTNPPAGPRVSLTQPRRTFRINALRFGSKKILWTLCGRPLRGQDSSISIARTDLKREFCTLRANITLTSALIRETSYQEQVQWRIKRR